LVKHGADATIRLDAPPQELSEAFSREAADSGFQVVIDYVWGSPVEALLSAMTRKEFAVIKSETRLVQVGESAGSTILLRAAVLRSTPLTILGTAGIPPRDTLVESFQQVMAYAARGDLRIETERVPLAQIENAWQQDPHGRRLVIIP
jgi:NADPH2:quinone reductase